MREILASLPNAFPWHVAQEQKQLSIYSDKFPSRVTFHGRKRETNSKKKKKKIKSVKR
jgi:hypothetical protein